MPLRGGSARFGIRRGELVLLLDGAQCPIEWRSFVPDLPPEAPIEVEVRHEQGSREERNIEEGVNSGIPLGVSAGGRVKRGHSSESTESVVKRFSEKFFTISAQGPDDSPTWVFKAPPGERVLRGALRGEELCRIYLLGCTCTVRAFFKTDRSNIILTSVEGVYPRSLVENKKGVIRSLISRWIRNQVNKVMSEGEIQYG